MPNIVVPSTDLGFTAEPVSYCSNVSEYQLVPFDMQKIEHRFLSPEGSTSDILRRAQEVLDRINSKR